MKLFVLAAIIAAVSSDRFSSQSQSTGGQTYPSPWQVGKQYRYEVTSRTLAHLQEGPSSGSAFKAQFTIRVKSPGRLQAKLENPQHGNFNEQLPDPRELPVDLKYQPTPNIDKVFEIEIDGGRIVSLDFPTSVPVPQENLIKGLISALQLDTSAHRVIHDSQNNYDREQQQGLFRKMETDVTGDCETLYTVSPVASEWRRELPKFANEQDPVEVTKRTTYGHCHHRVAYHFGVPVGAEWTGTAHKTQEQQLIGRATYSRILTGKEGPIYKAETTSTVHVHPHLYGKQKAEVYSHVHMELISVDQDSGAEWPRAEAMRPAQSILYSLSTKQMTKHYESSSSSVFFGISTNSISPEQHEHPHQTNQRSRRSYTRSKLVTVHKVLKKRSSESSSGSSSSSADSSSAYINDDIPDIDEPAYAALYMSPQPHADKKQNAMNAQKILQDIAQQLQNPNNMPKSDFLSKFNILVRLIASMSTEQLSQTSRSIETAKTSNNIIKSDMWMIFRDGVTQAGTLPAFKQIQFWMENTKIREEEAAQVVAALLRTLRYPTKQIMTQFFNFARSPAVTDQMFLNSSALMAATKLINLGQVNNYTAHSYYPTHMYGRLTHKHDAFVLEEILPTLAADLKASVEYKDSTKAQVYIQAIGNLGHREILKVFAPYLEGKVEISTYLRTHIVKNLKTLAKLRDRHVRAVLFSILRNTAEPYPVRVAAIQSIFISHPTGEMMQAMAEMTHNDPSVEVRAVLKSAILSAAELQHPRNFDLSRTAQAARYLVTNEEFGYQHSFKFIDDSYDEDNDIGTFVISHIGSEDSLLPKDFKIVTNSKGGAWERNTIEASFSSAERFLDYMRDSVFAPHPKFDRAHKYSAEKIAKLLNIKNDEEEPLEASFYVDFMNNQRLFSFSESDLQQLSQYISEYMKKVESGAEKHYTKVYNQDQVSIMFPVASGMPFIFKYKEPAVIHFQSKLKGKFSFPSKDNKYYEANMNKDVQFTYARNIDGNVGFMDTLSNQYSSVGVVNKLQFNIPFKFGIEIKSGLIKLRVEPLHPDQDQTLVHYSVWPYSASQKKDSLVAISQDPATKIVERRSKVFSVDSKYGQSTHAVIYAQGYTYSSDWRNFGAKFTSRDYFTNLASLLTQEDIALTHFNLKHLCKQSQSKALTITAYYDEYYNQQNSGKLTDATDRNDLSPNSETRRAEMVKLVSAGINKARVRVVDLSASFEGSQDQHYVFTGTWGDSPVDSKVQGMLFAGTKQGNQQINAVFTTTKPEIHSLSFSKALQSDLRAPFGMHFKYGQSGEIRVSGSLDRTKKYTTELENHPLAKQCSQQTTLNNFYQDSCHKAIVMAHAPDHVEFSVSFQDMSPQYRNFSYHTYRLYEYLGYWYTEANPLKLTQHGKMDFKIDFSYFDRTYTVDIASPSGEVRMRDMPIATMAPGALSFYQPLKAYELVANYFTGHQYQPYCSIDGTRIHTFSNRSYEYPLSRSWHVVMQDESTQRGNWHELAILSRRQQRDQQEIYISYKSESGKDLEIEIQPASGDSAYQVKVTTNTKKITDDDLTMYWDDVKEQPFLQYHTHKDGVLVINIEDDRIRAIYDGQRFVVFTQDYRNSTRGICGRMSGEQRDDYLTPEGLVDKPELYAAAYSLNEENSDPKTQELKALATQQAYYPEYKYTSILRSDPAWQEESQSSGEDQWQSETVYKSRSYDKHKGACEVRQQVQFYENHGDICITTSRVPSCQSHCRAGDYKIQHVQVTCKSKLDHDFRMYKEQIKKGQNPEVSGIPSVKQFKVPVTCQP
uniref:Vitellogenin n=1 Tax=Bombyx mandarina TaxID=7092 RepID=Q9BPP5_BOMMA|nr:vitellogenin [Bombyx mandarina]